MSYEPGQRESGEGNRAQTAVLGFILLVGVVAIASIGILVLAGETTGEIQTDSEVERVESAFVELGSELETAGASDDVTRSMDLDIDTEQGDVELVENGQLDVLVDNDSVFGPDASSPVPLQSLEYRGYDGDRIAYQGGGVWRGTGEETQGVSSPNVHYRDGTLGLPVTTLNGSTNLAHDTFAIENADTNSFGEYIGGENVTIEVTTTYYGGWETYFEDTFEGATVDVIDEDGGYNGAKTVVANLSSAAFSGDGTIDSGITVANELSAADGLNGSTFETDIVADRIDCDQNNNNNNNTTGPPGTEIDCPYQADGYVSTILEEYRHASNDSLIDGKIDRAANSGTNLGAVGDREGLVLNESLYHADSIDISDQDDTITVDLSDGDVVLAVDGDVEIEGDNAGIDIVNADDGNRFELFVGGSQAKFGGEGKFCVDSCDGNGAESNWLYGKSHTNVKIDSSGTTYEGVIYVPNDPDATNPPYSGNWDVHITGQSNVTGAVVGDNVKFSGGSGTQFTYDEALAGLQPWPGDQSNESTSGTVNHVHVSVYDLELHPD